MESFSNIDPMRLQELQSQAGAVLVDVRTDQEVGRGVIPGARHVPLHLLPQKMAELAEAPVLIFYCQSGARSAQACAFASGSGAREIYNLAGGILAWAGRGLPLANIQPDRTTA
jgi:rhodanese-related sulfurtransferase